MAGTTSTETTTEPNEQANNSQNSSFMMNILGYIPGLALSILVAWLGLVASEFIGVELLGFEKTPISGIMMAIIIGLVIGNTVQLPTWTAPGIRFGLKRVLKLGIILLGIRLSMGDVLRLGAIGIPLIIFCIAGALTFATWLGNRLSLSGRMSALIAVGTSICGTTAIVATGPAIDAKDEELTYAIANITLFGVLAMFLYPYLANGIFADDMTNAGLFLGTSIHETAQVAGSGLIYAEQYDADDTLDVATVTKLVRNVLMAFVIPFMSYQYHKANSAEAGQKVNPLSLFPMFILGFLGMALFRTIGDATLDSGGEAYAVFSQADWESITENFKLAAETLLAIAMAGVGLGTTFKSLGNLGIKPFYVGLGASVIVGVFSLIGITVLNGLGLT